MICFDKNEWFNPQQIATMSIIRDSKVTLLVLRMTNGQVINITNVQDILQQINEAFSSPEPEAKTKKKKAKEEAA